MNVKVTNEHVARGVRGNAHSCPIALAIKDATGGEMISVGHTWVIVDGRIARLASWVERFIADFDNGKYQEIMPRPFEFDLELAS